MNGGAWVAAIREWRAAVGAERVVDDAASVAALCRNVSGLVRRVPVVIRPRNADEVATVVRIARRHRTPVHPISRGRNWGMGSRLPPRDDTAVLDLSDLNRIRELNVAGRYAVVEPGVTQRQLYERLQRDRLPLRFNVTGSSADSSLIGNALERGVGYLDSRAAFLTGLEVVLGTGEVLRTGFAHFPGARTTHLYRWGVGPWLDGLFAQGNFGIVTAAGVELLPMPEAETAVIARIRREEELADLVDALADLRRRGLIAGVAHVGNRERSWITLAPLIAEQLIADGRCDARSARSAAEEILKAEGFGPWSAVAAVSGARAGHRAKCREVRRQLGRVARVTILPAGALATAERVLVAAAKWSERAARKLAVLRAVKPLHGLAEGVPTDDTLPAVEWPLGGPPVRRVDPDEGEAGLLYCLPILPAEGGFVAEVVAAVRRIFAARGFEAAITVNLLDDRSMEGVISLAFHRSSPEQTRAAQEAVREAEEELLRRGCPPYRVGLGSMDVVVRADDPFWCVVARLKGVLDPDEVISPGRYNLL
ncbi:MAG: FAD-binding oxidoreductase [Kiritimatiellae bacterium]|nr:FAD-binding oxidoreductase [Kiritimatiellia bacterium]